MQQGDTDEDKWKVLSLTHVEYQEGDSLGKLFAIYSLLPLAIVIVFLTAFFFRRDLHTLTFGVGVIVNYAANTVLKKYIAEPRPKQRSVQFEEFGMPSSHSQFMWFCSAYLVLFTLFRLTHTVTWKTLSVALYLGASSLMSYSRVYLQYHTPSQVVWGGVVGGLGALLWFLVTQLLFTPLYPTVERWAISEYFMIRDTSTIPNILWFEFVTIRGEVNTRKKASARKSTGRIHVRRALSPTFCGLTFLPIADKSGDAMQFWRLLALLAVPVVGSEWSFKNVFAKKAEKKNLLQAGGRRGPDRPAAAKDRPKDAVVLMQQEATVTTVGQSAEAVPASRDKENASAKPGTRTRQQMRENSLIKSLKHVTDSYGGASMKCVTTCRYGEVRHSWRECLERCVENGLLRATLMTMLPAEHHDPLHPELEMPDDLRAAVAKKKVMLNRMRSMEL